MDSKRFDALARSIAVPKTRRGLLGAVAALGAVLLAGQGTDAQVNQATCGNVRCKNNPGKCANGCVCCVWSNGNNRCVPAGQCNAGGTVLGGSTTATPTTTTTAAPGLCSDPVCQDACSAQCVQTIEGVAYCTTDPSSAVLCAPDFACSSSDDCPLLVPYCVTTEIGGTNNGCVPAGEGRCASLYELTVCSPQ